MAFVLVLQGVGDGCDYTIGCNMRYAFLKAVTVDEARIEAEAFVTERLDRVDKAWLCDLVTPVDLDRLRRTQRQREQEEADRRTEEQERRMLAALQAKYGTSQPGVNPEKS